MYIPPATVLHILFSSHIESVYFEKKRQWERQNDIGLLS